MYNERSYLDYSQSKKSSNVSQATELTFEAEESMSDLCSSPVPFLPKMKRSASYVFKIPLYSRKARVQMRPFGHTVLPDVEILLCQDRVRPVIDMLVIADSTRHHRCYPTLVQVHQLALPTLVS